MVAQQTFDVLDKNKIASGEEHETEGHTAVSPNSFMMTAIRYPWCSVRMRLMENQSFMIGVRGVPEKLAHFRSVDFPAPRNPDMIVRGTW
jgi:hypothetical protein